MTKTMTKAIAPVALKAAQATGGWNSLWFLNQPKMPKKLMQKREDKS